MSSTEFRKLSGLQEEFESWTQAPRETSFKVRRLATCLDEEKYTSVRFGQIDLEALEQLEEAAALGDDDAKQLLHHHKTASKAFMHAAANHSHWSHPKLDAKGAEAGHQAWRNAEQLHNNAAMLHRKHGLGKQADHHEKAAKSAKAFADRYGERAAMHQRQAKASEPAKSSAPAKAEKPKYQAHADPFPSKKAASAGDHHRGRADTHKKTAHAHMNAAMHALVHGNIEGAKAHSARAIHHATKHSWYAQAASSADREPIPAGPRAATGRG